MYMTIKISPRRVKYHDMTWPGHEAFIPSNTPYVQIHNGAIGGGQHYKNYPIEVVQKMLMKARTEHVHRTGEAPKAFELNEYEMNNAELESKIAFTADDIPF